MRSQHDDDNILQDGETFKCSLKVMDTAQREFMLQAQQVIDENPLTTEMARDEYINRITDAWQGGARS